MTHEIPLEYFINDDFTFKIRDNRDEKISIKLQANWNILNNVIFRMRIFAINPPNQDEFNQICQISWNKQPSENNKFHHGLKGDEFGIEIEILHLMQFQRKHWSKWKYPWNDNVYDMRLYRNYEYFSKRVDFYCFGAYGKYYILCHYMEKRIWEYGFNFKFGYLSKFKVVFRLEFCEIS